MVELNVLSVISFRYKWETFERDEVSFPDGCEDERKVYTFMVTIFWECGENVQSLF